MRASYDLETTNPQCQKMAIYAVIATTGLEGLCTMILMNGAIPRPARFIPCQTQIMRMHVNESAMMKVQRKGARSSISYALRHPHGLKGKEESLRFLEHPAGEPVLVYLIHECNWTGTHIFISVENETVVVQRTNGRRIFRSTHVKPWARPLITVERNKMLATQLEPTVAENKNDAHACTDVEDDLKIGQPRKVLRHYDDKQFEEARRQELNGLL